MEYVILLGVLGLGYKMQMTEKSDNNNNKKKQLPSVEKNVYESNRAFDIFQEEQKKANILYEKSKNPDEKIIIPGPTLPILYNKVDYTNDLPIEFNNYQKYDNILIDDTKMNNRNNNDTVYNNSPKKMLDSGGFQGISLSGNPINPDTFTHNNMTPFFGGSVKQNLDEFSNRGMFENFTGTQDNYQKKQEQTLLFEPQKNMSNVYGKSSLDGFMLDRYHVSNLRSNETPIEKVYVGPGLNKGYESNPSGGFQQENTLDYVRPKTTDEMRVKTNPKMSYNGRIVAGEKINKPGKIGTIFKNRPDTYFEQEADRYFTTVGSIIAPEQRPCIVAKYTNRKTTQMKTRKGSVAPVNGTIAQIRSKYKTSKKISYKSDGPRNADNTGSWNILNMIGLDSVIPNDYGKKAIKVRDNNRVLDTKNKKEQVINFKSSVDLGVSRIQQKIKNTKKIIQNNRQNGNYQGIIKKIKVYNS